MTQDEQLIRLRGGRRSSIGNNCIFGDARWGGYYGIEAEFIAADNCKIVSFEAEDMKARPEPPSESLAT